MSRGPRSLNLSSAAVTAVRSGHPWVYRERGTSAPVGALVELCGRGGRAVGWGLADEGPIAVRVLGRGPAPGGATVRDVVHRRVAEAAAARRVMVGSDTDAYRVVAGAGDGLPGLVVDRYAHVAVLRIYSAAWERHLQDVVDSLAALDGVRTVYRRLGVRRVDGERGGDVLFGEPLPDHLVVTEHGMRMLVRPDRGQKTGLFLDQREHRAWVRRVAGGAAHAANLFGYNGGFSVAAALGGARRVVTVDIAPDALEDARENFRLNGLDPARHGFDAADAFAWRSGRRLDLLVLDPPSLAKTREQEGAARAAYRSLHEHHGKSLAHGGLLATASCTGRIGLDVWRREVIAGLGEGAWSWMWTSCEPPDHPVALGHPEGRYLKFALLRRRGT